MLLLALREAEAQIEAAVEAEDYELAGSLNDEVDQLNGTIAEVSQLQQPAACSNTVTVAAIITSCAATCDDDVGRDCIFWLIVLFRCSL